MFPVLFIKFVIVELHGGGAAIGIIRGCTAFGGFAASLLVIRFAQRTQPEKLMMWGYMGFAVVAALFINAPLVTRGAIGATVGTIAAGLLVDHLLIIPLFNVQAFVYLLCCIAIYWLIIRRTSVAVVGLPGV